MTPTRTSGVARPMFLRPSTVLRAALLLSLAASALLVPGCNSGLSGNGHATTELRDVDAEGPAEIRFR